MSEISEEPASWQSEEWPTFDIKQYGPDGTTQVGLISFWLCPSCGVLVPGTADEPDYWRNIHRGFHQELQTISQGAQSGRWAEAMLRPKA